MLIQPYRSLLFPAVMLLLMAGCGERALETQVNNIGTLEGRVSSKTGSLSLSDPYALACSSWTAKLFSLNENHGSLADAPLLTTSVANDGSFKFEKLASVQVKLANSRYPKYAVVIEGCDKRFLRPVTSSKNQNITPASDLLLRSVSMMAAKGKSLNQVAISDLHTLMDTLDTFNVSTLHEVYTILVTEPSIKSLFVNAYGFDPTDLQYLPPEIKLGLNPLTVDENTSPNFLASLTHWHPGYPKRALWYEGAIYLGEGETASLPISKNMQGLRTLTVRGGYSTGPTSIDLTKATVEATVSTTVGDRFPVQAPVLTRTSPVTAIATSRVLTLSVNTGASLANCATFSALALTEDAMIPPLSPSDYTILCASGPAQALPYNLMTTGEGVKTLRLWAMDSSGNVSSASTLNVTLDTITPAAPSITRVSAAVASSTTVQIQNANCNDNATKILFSTSSTTPSPTDVAWQACAVQNYGFTVATDGPKTIYAFLKDDADHISPSSSITMTLDTTLPVLNLTSAPALNDRLRGGSTFTVSWTSVETNYPSTPVTLETSADGGTNWATSVAALASSGSITWSVPSYTGSNFKLRVKGIDQAGNTGYSSGSPAFAIDSTSPNVTLTSLTGGQLLRGGSNATLTWVATDNLLAANPIGLHYSADGGGTWTPIATSLPNTGTYTWVVPSQNGNAFRVRVTALDAVGLSSSDQSASSFSIDSTAPSVTLLSLTGGQTIPGAGAVSVISWSASDARLTTAPITLEYSANSGSGWMTIAAGLTNSGTYSWAVSAADAITYRVRVSAVDQVGNVGSAGSASDFAVSSTAPVLTQTSAPSNINSNILAQVTYGGACETGLTVSVTGAETTSFTCPAGTWTWTTATHSTDATRSYTFSQTNGAALTTSVTVVWKRDTAAPSLSSVTINAGATSTAIPQVTVDIASLETNIEVRLGMAEAGTGDCQVGYADNNWRSHSSLSAAHLFSMPVGDGLKKVCVWTRDQASNVSVFAPATGTAGVNTDSINLEAGTSPTITALSVTNDVLGGTTYAAGARVNITWTVTDTEGLHNDPVTLDYTTDAGITWVPIVTNYGGLSANPTTYTKTYLAFNAPTTGVFRVRIRAVDSAGNTAAPIISNIQNGSRWSVYAGSADRGIGGDAKSLRLKIAWTGQFGSYAVNPLNGDVYLLTDSTDVVRVDRSSGRTSVFLTYASGTNLPDSGPIPALPTGRLQAHSRLAFDRNGKLYLSLPVNNSGTASATIYQFDLVQNTVRKYIGGGTIIDGSATAPTAQVTGLGFSFDNSNALYYAAYCTPGVFNATSTVRIMKATQKADGTVDTISVLGGNCTRGTPTYGNTATSEPVSNLGETAMGLYGKVQTNGTGTSVYFKVYNQAVMKIQNAKIYSSAIGSVGSDFEIDGITNRIYQSNAGDVGYWSIGAVGNGGETFTKLAAKSGTDIDCWNDGKPALQACVNSYSGAMLGPDRIVYFIDNIDGGGFYRVRYIDANNTIRTVAGGKPVHGEGLSRDLVKVGFHAIYYKQASEPNQTAFPEGLYFTSANGFVFGHLNDNSPLTVLWGNQKSASIGSWTVGSAINPQVTLGNNGFIGSYPMTFDSAGLPWIRLHDAVYSVDAAKLIVQRSVKSTPGYKDYWDDAVAGEPAKKFGASAYGLSRNFVTKKDHGVIFLGRSTISGRPANDAMLRYHDYTNDIVHHIMGGAGGTSSTPDSVSPASLETASLGLSCISSTTGCSPRYVEGDPTIVSDDVLYFSEGTALRKIANPLVPPSNFLSTVFTTTSAIQNYIFSQDGRYVYYVRGAHLFCHAVSAADVNAICKNVPASHVDLGPPNGMAILEFTGGDMMTWRSSSRLLINNAVGEIYEFNVTP